MTSANFKTLEDPLRHFFGRTCVKLSNNDATCIKVLSNGKKAFDELEYGEFIFVLTKNAVREGRQSKIQKLFSAHAVNKSTIDELHYAANLRNKYFHVAGFHTPDSKEQLGDLLIVQRVVDSLSKLCEPDVETANLLAVLDKGIEELIIQVAQATKPDQFDTEGEKQILGPEDRNFLVETFKGMTQEIFAATSNGHVATQDHDSSPLLTNTLTDLQRGVRAIEKKIAPMDALKGRMDGLEMNIINKVSDVHTAVEALSDMNALEGASNHPGPDSRDDWETDDFYADDDEIEIVDEDRDNEEPVETTYDFTDSSHNQVLKLLKTLPPPIDIPRRLNRWQARDEMISLRKRIWRETGEGPCADGLLRKSMIDEFLEYLPISAHDANHRMKWLLKSVSPAQLPYLEDVCSIISRMEALDN